ncbi:flexible cuticle protein 12-like [Vanessa cardui]|uniref:flexible cuticle protein 12-like n=1 Tax=Vanessa cardui TaxID=171605 RepID=UPI001F14389D|nr:flexible cuticle protein 12-like [Vanessa cardui]XP_046960700.1 flexible cuticle protein 12-like [Vanessa cardui]
MKLFVVLCFVAVACAAPPYETAQVVRYENDNIGTGSYRVAVEQTDGTQHEVVGEQKNNDAVSVRGSYAWNAPDGVRYVVTYEADELGYRSTIDKQGVPKYTSVV